MFDMYLMQIVAALQGTDGRPYGAPERDVVRAMKDLGDSAAMVQYEIDRAVRVGVLRRVWCRCQ